MARLVAWLGWDPREQDAYAVAKQSIHAHTGLDDCIVLPLQMGVMQQAGIYTRPTTRIEGRLWDVISNAPMSTEHAITRFWVPFLYNYKGWALFADCDILVRRDLHELFALADPKYAVMVVKHDYRPVETSKMDGQVQSAYPRKNWSSVILWNCAHPSHRPLKDLLNTMPGRDLHRFCWLHDDEIGELPPEWNYLVGVSPKRDDVAIAHFTLGIPSMEGYEQCEFAEEWRAYAL